MIREGLEVGIKGANGKLLRAWWGSGWEQVAQSRAVMGAGRESNGQVVISAIKAES
jgi:hypothetical protein